MTDTPTTPDTTQVTLVLRNGDVIKGLLRSDTILGSDCFTSNTVFHIDGGSQVFHIPGDRIEYISNFIT